MWYVNRVRNNKMKFKFAKCLAALMSLAILSSCGGGSSSQPPSSSLNVTSITPTNGSHITTNQTFVVQFNNQLDPLSVGKVTLVDESGLDTLINCTAAHNNVLSCVPAANLAYNYGYKLTLPATIKDTAGNSLTAVTYNYTTYDQAIGDVSPPSGAIDVNITKFTFNFNTPMNRATLNSTQTPNNVVMVEGNPNSTTSSSSLNAATSLPLNCTDIDSKTMECNLANGTQFQANKNYTLTLTNQIQESNGTPITPQNVSYQTSNVVTPNVSVNPQGGSPIGLNQLSYVLSFNTLMNQATVNQNNVIFTDNDSGTSYPLSCATTDSQSYTCNVLNLGSLVQDHKYTLSISSVISASGVTMPNASFAYSASNYITPMVNFITPAVGAISPTTLSYSLQFTTPMNMDTFSQGVIFTDIDAGNNIPISCTSSDNINVICVLQGVTSLIANHNYMLSLSSSITSAAGIGFKAVNYAYAATDYTVPQVESITPNNSGVLPISGATFVVTFNTPIDASSIDGNVEFVDNTTKIPAPVSCRLTAESVMTCTTGGLNHGDQYSLTLTTGIKSNIGVPLSQDLVFNYSVLKYAYFVNSQSNSYTQCKVNLFGIESSTCVTITPTGNGALVHPVGIAFNGNYAYFTNADFSSGNHAVYTQCEVNASGIDPTTCMTTYATNILPIYRPTGLAFSGNYAYFANGGGSAGYAQCEVNASGIDSTTCVEVVPSTLNNPLDILDAVAFNGNYAYFTVSNVSSYMQCNVNASIIESNTCVLIKPTGAGALGVPIGIAFNGNYAYFANSQQYNSYTQCNVGLNGIESATCVTIAPAGLNSLGGIAFNGNYAYFTNINSNSYTQCNVGSNGIYPATCVKTTLVGLNSPQGIAFN